MLLCIASASLCSHTIFRKMGFTLKVSGMLVLLVAIFVVEQSAQPHDHEFGKW